MAVDYPEAVEHFTAELRKDPNAPRPPIRLDTTKDFFEWKNEMRAYDAALIAAGLATPQEITRRNSIFPPQQGRARIVSWPNYGQPSKSL